MSTQSTLIEVLKNCTNLSWDNHIYYLESRPLATTECKIITAEELENMEEENTNYPGHVFGIAQIQDIVSNLNQKYLTPTDNQYMEAFTYYIDNDAFIVQ